MDGHAPNTREQCQELDRCRPGGGLFGLGDSCYKWAAISDPEDLPRW